MNDPRVRKLSVFLRVDTVMLLLLFGGLPESVLAQARPAATSPVGVWRGMSVCLVRPSGCNDETAVYRISRSNAGDSLSIDGRKVVNGQEVEMGILACRLDASGTQFTCAMPQGTWHFAVRGDSLVGDLTLPDGRRFRDVRLVRSAPAGL